MMNTPTSISITTTNKRNSKYQKIPAHYDVTNLTWKEKILFVINKLGTPGALEIVEELIKLEPSQTRAFLYKRVGVTLSQLKTGNLIDVNTQGKKGKYFIK